MLAANEATAAQLESLGVPCLYRVHEPPDPLKLKDLRDFIKPLGLSFRMKGDRVAPEELQRLLGEVEGRPEEKMVNEILLRCMKQARYAAENLGHFGLASPSYLHFTSPIRRYPDLVVHRVLKQVLAGGMKKREKKVLADRMPETAELTSRRERTAMEAEREIVELKRLQYMEDRVGETFAGFITGVTAFGFFVELSEFLVEGLVHVSALGDDFYRLLEKQHTLVGERSGRKFRIGDQVRVQVTAVSRVKRRIELSPADAVRSSAAGGRQPTEKPGRKPSKPARRGAKARGAGPRRGGRRR